MFSEFLAAVEKLPGLFEQGYQHALRQTEVLDAETEANLLNALEILEALVERADDALETL